MLLSSPCRVNGAKAGLIMTLIPEILLQATRRFEFIMSKQRCKSNSEKFLPCFIKKNRIVTILAVVMLVYCLICSIFKGSELLNINNSIIRAIGDLLNNIGISIIAAYVFLVFQSWLYFRREGIIQKYATTYVRMYFLRDCEILLAQLELIRDGKKEEKELNESIAKVCERIQNEIFMCTTKYRDGLTDSLYDYIDALYFDTEFYMIENRARGQLSNMSMKSIIQEYMTYEQMESIIKNIKKEVNGI